MTVPPGDEAVDDALQLHEGDSRGPAGLLDENHRVGGQARLLQPVTKSTGDGPVGSQGRRGPSQQSGIARLEAEPGGVAGHVGTILVDDTDHAQAAPGPAGRTTRSDAPIRRPPDRPDRGGPPPCGALRPWPPPGPRRAADGPRWWRRLPPDRPGPHPRRWPPGCPRPAVPAAQRRTGEPRCGPPRRSGPVPDWP